MRLPATRLNARWSGHGLRHYAVPVDVLIEVGIVGAVLAVVAVLVVKGPRYLRRGRTVLGVYEEIYHPAAHLARGEVQVQEERVTPSPTPDGE